MRRLHALEKEAELAVAMKPPRLLRHRHLAPERGGALREELQPVIGREDRLGHDGLDRRSALRLRRFKGGGEPRVEDARCRRGQRALRGPSRRARVAPTSRGDTSSGMVDRSLAEVGRMSYGSRLNYGFLQPLNPARRRDRGQRIAGFLFRGRHRAPRLSLRFLGGAHAGHQAGVFRLRGGRDALFRVRDAVLTTVLTGT